jgi:AraC-like DNA-binding protein
MNDDVLAHFVPGFVRSDFVVESVRVDAAIRLLHVGESVTACAQRVGVGSPETLRRMFVAHVGVSPRAYQQRFSRAAGSAGPPGTG